MAAVVTLACLALPAPAALAAASHLFAHHGGDHQHADQDHSVDLRVVWHGHEHAPETPEHEHRLVLDGTHPLQLSKPRVTPLQAQHPVAYADAAEAVPLHANWRSHAPPGVPGVGPPQLDRIPILRI